MNETQFKIFVRDLENMKETLTGSISDIYDGARDLCNAYDVLVQNCDILVEQLRESRSTAHKLREQLKKYEPETTL